MTAEVNIPQYKRYRGSASAESYSIQGKTSVHRSPEGEASLVPYKGPVRPILDQLKAGVQSGMSYIGANNLDELRKFATFVEISHNGFIESKAHGAK
jgi:IMP dehydrogenase